MGWLDTPEERRRQHVQVIAGGNIKDMDRIHERDRRRNITGLFWFLFIISAILGFLIFKTGFVKNSFYFFGFSILMLVVLIFRYGLHKSIKSKGHGSSWQRIRELPDWAYRKMKKRHKNRVNGEHYVYKKEGNKFYRKLK